MTELGPASQATLPGLRRLIAVLGAAMFLDAMLFGVLAPLLPSYVDDLGLTTTEAGVLSGAVGAGLLLSALPTAALANRMGAKRAVILGLCILAAASTAFAIADTFEVMVVSRFFQGAAGASIWAGGLTWVSGAADPTRRGAAIGSLIGIGVAGTVAGPLAGSLAIATSPNIVFGAVPMIALGLIVPVLTLRQQQEGLQPGGLSRLWSQPAARLAAFVNLWFLLIPAVALGLVGVLGPLRLDEFGAAATLIGLVFLSAGAIEAVMNAGGGRLADRIGTAPILRVGMITIGIAVGVFALVSGIATTAVVIVVLGACMGLFGAPVNISLHAVLDGARVGDAHAFGFYNLGFSGGYLVGATGGSALADLGGDLLPCLLLAGGALASAPLVRFTLASPERGIAPTLATSIGDRGRR